MEEHLKVLVEAYAPEKSGNGVTQLFGEHLTPNTVKTLLENVIIRKLISIFNEPHWDGQESSPSTVGALMYFKRFTEWGRGRENETRHNGVHMQKA